MESRAVVGWMDPSFLFIVDYLVCVCVCVLVLLPPFFFTDHLARGENDVMRGEARRDETRRDETRARLVYSHGPLSPSPS